MIITENRLDEWVRGNAREAQGIIVELILRLVSVSCPKPTDRRFPLGDSMGQPGPDGVLNTDHSYEPFVPQGHSLWEIGTGKGAQAKATQDYRDRTRNTPEATRLQSTLVLVTPLSGATDWPATWKKRAQNAWLERRKKRGEWREIRIVDGTRLVDWVHSFPPVELWLAEKIGGTLLHVESAEHRWATLKTIGEPPPLTPDLFLANREAACDKLKEMLAGTTLQVKLETRFPRQMADFVCAVLAGLEIDTRIETISRSLIIHSADAWSSITGQCKDLILIADFDLDEVDGSATRLLEIARRSGHYVIFSGMPGGIPHPHRAPIPNPKIHQIDDALKRAGYKEERARILAQRSGGNLGTLLRCLQNLSLTPEWSQGTEAAELALAELLGSWSDKSDADKTAIEGLVGKAYGEWIGKIRRVALRPTPPLTQRDGFWRFAARYEGWYALGPLVFDEHLDRFKTMAISILREVDPKFDLPPTEHYAASIKGKVLSHSRALRHGLAETLALLGSHPKPLSSASLGKPEVTAALAVRSVLSGADWHLWASVNDLLPLMAEAAPREFLDAVEEALNSDPCPFDTVYAQETTGFGGGNYVTGLLWALETLAWDAEHLTRALVLLGELAARDPGGNWGNRPKNSMTTILLPWIPQTCAPVNMRKVAVETLLAERPNVGWTLLLGLLPQFQQVSSHTRRPSWRELIPDDWTAGVTDQEYWEQVAIYAELATAAANADPSKLPDLIDRWDDLPPLSRDKLASDLRSEVIAELPEEGKLPIWTALVEVASKHRKYIDAKWALELGEIERIEALAEDFAPTSPFFRYLRLFSEQEFGLYEEKGNYKEQAETLEKRRQSALQEVYAGGGVESIMSFAKTVESPWRVGLSFGAFGDPDAEGRVIPALLTSEDKVLSQFAGGFVWGSFRARGWAWIDSIDTSNWSPEQKGQLLAYLPFEPETWKRVGLLLPKEEGEYWKRCNANPYWTDADLTGAVDEFLRYGRAQAAVGCLYRMLSDKRPTDPHQAIRALRAVPESAETPGQLDAHAIIELIKALQESPQAPVEDLAKLEWVYLPLLDEPHDAFPKILEQRLAGSPDFFCEVVRVVFRSKNESKATAESQASQPKGFVENAYRLLNRWRLPPGSRGDGTFDGGLLETWLERVKALCLESGHLEVGLSMVGHVLIHVPKDPDGLWIHRAAAVALNAKDVDAMRDGYRTALFNSRGVHGFTAGKSERAIAERYRKKGQEVEAHGFHRLANTLRELAESYERDAERESTRDPHGD